MRDLHVVNLRGRLVESVFRVSVAVVDEGGRLVARAGDPDRVTFLRSAAKPFQAVPLVEDGAAERFDVSSEELALACASHNSEPEQVALVRAWLERIGCTEADLACGPHRPLWMDLALEGTTVPGPRVPRTPVASNCSGKHTGMLAVARHHGWPTEGYHRAEHPVQRRVLDAMAQCADVPPDSIGMAVDGCGVTTFAVPLVRAAGAFARLVVSGASAPSAIVAAMTGHPGLVAGRGRLDTALMEAYPGAVLAKVGAEGVYGAGLPHRGLGVALKVEDGHGWAAVAALLAVLDQLELLPPPSATLPAFAVRTIRNTRAEPVGEMRADGALTFV